MMYCVYHRYGEQSRFDDCSNAVAVFKALLGELRREEFSEPDDEHDSVGVVRDPFGISISCCGVVTFFRTGQGDNRYLQDVPDRSLIPLLVALANGDMEVVNAAPWLELDQLKPVRRDFYRSSSK